MGVDPSIHLYEVRPEKFKNFDDNQSNWQPLLLTPYQIIIIKRKFIVIWNNDSAITRALFCEFTKLRLVSKIQSINLLISLGSVPNQQHPSCLLFNARVRLIEIALFFAFETNVVNEKSYDAFAIWPEVLLAQRWMKSRWWNCLSILCATFAVETTIDDWSQWENRFYWCYIVSFLFKSRCFLISRLKKQTLKILILNSID